MVWTTLVACSSGYAQIIPFFERWNPHDIRLARNVVLLAADTESQLLTVMLPLIGLIAVILLGAAAFALANRWFKSTQERDATAVDQLSEFRRLKQEGELSDEEFRKIKSLLSDKVRSEAGLSAKPAPPPAKANTPSLGETVNPDEGGGDTVEDIVLPDEQKPVGE